MLPRGLDAGVRERLRRGAAPQHRAARGCAPVGRDRLRGAARRSLRRPRPWCAAPAPVLRRRRRRRRARMRPTCRPSRRGARRHRAQGRGALHAAARGADRAQRTGRNSRRCCRRCPPARRARGWRASHDPHPQFPDRAEGRLQADHPAAAAHVRVRHHGLRLLHIGHARMLLGVRRHQPLPAPSRLPSSPTCATSPTSTTRSSSAPRENGEPIEALTERFIAAMHEDCARSASCRRITSRAPRSSCRRSSP